jgi:hypothetical protein
MKAQRQNPNLFCIERREDSAPPRVSIVYGFTPVPRGRVGHPPPAKDKRSPQPVRKRRPPAEVKVRELQNPHPLPTPQRVRHPQKISVHLSSCGRVGHPPEKIRHPASFNRAWVYSGAARKGWPPAGRVRHPPLRSSVRKRTDNVI